MGDVVLFKRTKKIQKNKIKALADKAKSNTLCKSGFHQWETDNNTQFAVKEGKLLTRLVCKRCGKVKNKTC